MKIRSNWKRQRLLRDYINPNVRAPICSESGAPERGQSDINYKKKKGGLTAPTVGNAKVTVAKASRSNSEAAAIHMNRRRQLIYVTQVV